ncbi:MAG: hypothetical protein WDN04_00460 [Rhodospirillales bacterium]
MYQNASGTVTNNVIRNEFAAPFASYGGCQSGLGIFVQTAAGHNSNVVITKNMGRNLRQERHHRQRRRHQRDDFR